MFVSQSQRAPGNTPDAATKAYEAMALAVMKMAQGSPSTAGNVQAKREIQSKLSQLMKHGEEIRDGWKAIMQKPTANQVEHADEARQWHSQIEHYLSTIPRGNAYIAKLNGTTRTGFGGWPLGLNQGVSETYDLLISDLAALNEFMNDPELGEP
jgi:hypothetical protein